MTFQFRVVTVKIFTQIRASQRSLLNLLMRHFKVGGGFATFPRRKEVRGSPRNSVRTSAHPRRRLISKTSGRMKPSMWMRLSGRWKLLCSEPAVYCDDPGAAASSCLREVSMVLASASFWSTFLLRGKQSSRLWRLSRGHHTSVYGGFQKNFFSWVSCSRCSQLEKWCGCCV